VKFHFDIESISANRSIMFIAHIAEILKGIQGHFWML